MDFQIDTVLISSHDSNNTNKDPLLNKIFFSKYKTIKKLGEGSFGKVYKAIYDNKLFAIKFEKRSSNHSLLESEATIMNYLKCKYIPNIESFGQNNEYNILIMQLMDKSLEELINIYKTFSIKTTCLLAYQMINILQFIHDNHIIHRDIKPDNFVMGINEKNQNLYILDFGLAKKYRSSKNLVQYPLIKKKKLTGTARYASINALEENEQSRRDDLESVSYVLMYFLRGSLPWQGLKVKVKEERYQKILEKKKETSSEELCKGFPKEFSMLVSYSRNLGYYDEPQYKKLRKMFLNLVFQIKEKFDFVYDWTKNEDIKIRDNDNNFIEDDIYDSDDNYDDEYHNLENEKKKDEVATSGNNLSLYKTIMTEGNGKTNVNSNNNINVIIENKKCVGNFSSRCCIMYNIILFNFFSF